MRETGISTASKTLASLCISSGTRVDGRSNLDSRDVKISLGPAWGFAEVCFEKTRAVASTSVEAITPSPDRKGDGTVSLSLELSAAAAETNAREALFKPSGPPSYTEMRNCIEGFVRESRALDTEALCILAGVKVWSVLVEVDVINDDGNIMDVCMLAVMASLMHARRPDVTVSGKEVRIHTMDEREPVPLPVHHVPLCVTYALFGGGKPYEPDIAVVDPVKLEEHACGGLLTFAFNAQGQACGVYKAGGLPMQAKTLVQCSEAAAGEVVRLTKVLKGALDELNASHPLATTRPMLARANADAVMGEQEGQDGDGDELRAGAMWNAIPVQDEATPVVMETVEEKIEKMEKIEKKEKMEMVEKKMEDVIEARVETMGSKRKGGSRRRGTKK